MDADLGEIGQRVRQFGKLDPVELDVLPRGEMAVAAVIAPRDMRERPQLLRRQRSVGDRDAEHIGVQLQIDAVLQPQHLEFVLGEFAGQPALHLIAKFRDAFVDDRAIEFVICIHQTMALCRNRKIDGDALRAGYVHADCRALSRRLSLTSTGAI